jgi:hypothetical protein
MPFGGIYRLNFPPVRNSCVKRFVFRIGRFALLLSASVEWVQVCVGGGDHLNNRLGSLLHTSILSFLQRLFTCWEYCWTLQSCPFISNSVLVPAQRLHRRLRNRCPESLHSLSMHPLYRFERQYISIRFFTCFILTKCSG